MAYEDIEFIVGICVICVNGLTMLTLILLIIKRTRSRTVFLLQLNLVVSDIAIGTFLVVKQYYTFEKRQCTAMMGYGLTAIFASLLSITLISIDRYFYLYHDVFYATWFNAIRTASCMFVLWVIGAVIGFTPLDWSQRRKRHCDFVHVSRASSLIYRSLISIFLICCTLFVLANIVYRQIKRYPLSSMPSFFQTRARFLYGIKREVTTRCALIASTLLALWLPHMAIALIYDMMDEEENAAARKRLADGPYAITLLMLYSNSIVNPVLYTWSHYGFYSYFFHGWLARDADTASMRSANALHQLN